MGHFLPVILILVLHAILASLHVCSLRRMPPSQNFSSLSSTSIQSIPSTCPIRAKLIHRHSIQSPYHHASLSLTQRQAFHNMWIRTAKRAASIRDSLQRQHDPGFKTPISGADYGSGAEYLMEISIGTPPQTFLTVADTGSSLVWLQCQPCPNCTPSHGSIFKPSISSSYQPLPCDNVMCQLLNAADSAYYNPDLLQCAAEKCEFQYLYGDLSSAVGTLSSESVSLERMDGQRHEAGNFVFGCAHHSANDFYVSGLVGLGPRPYSFTSQLGSTLGPKFSYCLVNLQHSLNMSSLMLFGNPHSEGMQYTPLVNAHMNTSSYYYYVEMEGMSLGKNMLGIPKATFKFNIDTFGGSIIDSGTTFTVVPQLAYEAIMGALDATVKHPKTKPALGEYDGLVCYNTSGVKHPHFPRLTLHLKGLELVLPRRNTFTRVGKHSFCLAVTSSGANSNLTIIGNMAQQDYLVEFDLQSQRVGFLPINCAHLSSSWQQ